MTVNHLSQRIVAAMRQEDAEYRRLIARIGRVGVAFDEGEVEELSAEELARKVLKKLGIDATSNGNSLEALNHWLDGHERASDRVRGVRSGMDSADVPEWFANITK